MGQHHATAADSDTRGRRRNGWDQHFRTIAGQSRSSMVFRQPIPPVTLAIGNARKVDGVSQSIARPRALRNGALIKNVQRY